MRCALAVVTYFPWPADKPIPKGSSSSSIPPHSRATFAPSPLAAVDKPLRSTTSRSNNVVSALSMCDPEFIKTPMETVVQYRRKKVYPPQQQQQQQQQQLAMQQAGRSSRAATAALGLAD